MPRSLTGLARNFQCLACPGDRSFRLNFLHRTYKALFSLSLPHLIYPLTYLALDWDKSKYQHSGIGQMSTPSRSPFFFCGTLCLSTWKATLQGTGSPESVCWELFQHEPNGIFDCHTPRSDAEKSLLISQSYPSPTRSALSALIMSSSRWLLAFRSAQLLK